MARRDMGYFGRDLSGPRPQAMAWDPPDGHIRRIRSLRTDRLHQSTLGPRWRGCDGSSGPEGGRRGVWMQPLRASATGNLCGTARRPDPSPKELSDGSTPSEHILAVMATLLPRQRPITPSPGAELAARGKNWALNGQVIPSFEGFAARGHSGWARRFFRNPRKSLQMLTHVRTCAQMRAVADVCPRTRSPAGWCGHLLTCANITRANVCICRLMLTSARNRLQMHATARACGHVNACACSCARM